MTLEQIQIDLSEKIAKHFYGVHRAIREKIYSEFRLKGGRGSSKSSFVALQIILGILDDPTANAIGLRKIGTTIRDSINTSLLWAIDELKQTDQFDCITSPAEMTYRPTGQKILMRGLDEPRKLKSIKVRHGYFKYLWFEEAEEYSGMEEIRSVEQSVLRGGEDFIEFFTYNPPRNPKHWINKTAKDKNTSQLIHHSTYLDVPRHWLGNDFFKKAARLKRNNFDAYQHEYLGKPIGNPEEIIFSGKYEERDFKTPPVNELYQSRFFFGADWGFANDPTVLIRCFIKDDCLWIDYEAYGYKVEIDHLHKLFDKIPESRKWMIKADCARPETISNVYRQNFKIMAAKKWLGCDIDGVEYLKSFRKIIIHKRCKKIIKEFDNYSYKIDKHTREVLADVDDKSGWDHGIDAVRYGLGDYIRNRIITSTGFSV